MVISTSFSSAALAAPPSIDCRARSAPASRSSAFAATRSAAAAIPDALIDSQVIHGSPEECREKLQRYFDNGVDTVVIELVHGLADPMQAARDLAPR